MKTFTICVYTEDEGGMLFPSAHALESDTVVTGEDHLDALKNMKTALEMELDHGAKLEPAPEEIWELVKKEGIIVKLDVRVPLNRAGDS